LRADYQTDTNLADLANIHPNQWPIVEFGVELGAAEGHDVGGGGIVGGEDWWLISIALGSGAPVSPTWEMADFNILHDFATPQSGVPGSGGGGIYCGEDIWI
jgi:hypothetical protein